MSFIDYLAENIILYLPHFEVNQSEIIAVRPERNYETEKG